MTSLQSNLILTGKTKDHLVPYEGKLYLHKEAIGPFLKLQKDAKKDGIDLSIASSFRDFDRQLRIWNNKVISFSEEDLFDEEIVKKILRWSAVPGASRHHWGTDVDVYDMNALPLTDYKVELTPEEADDVFGDLHKWLDEKIASNDAHGFFRPYGEDLGGVSPEKWHLSFAPQAQEYFDQYSFELFLATVQASEIMLKEVVLDQAKEIFDTYIRNISLP